MFCHSRYLLTVFITKVYIYNYKWNAESFEECFFYTFCSPLYILSWLTTLLPFYSITPGIEENIKELLKELWKDDSQPSLDKLSLHNSLKKRRSVQETKILFIYA